MSEKKNVLEVENSGDAVIAKAKDFWAKYSKLILIAGTTLIVLVGGFFIYKTFYHKFFSGNHDVICGHGRPSTLRLTQGKRLGVTKKYDELFRGIE